MKTLLGGMAGVALALVAVCAHAQEVSFEDLARHTQYDALKISPDGKHIGAIAVVHGKPVLALFEPDGHKGVRVQPRDASDQVVDFWWVSNKRVVYAEGLKVAHFAQPEATGELFAVNVDGTEARILVGARAGQSVSADLIDTLRDDDEHVLISEDDWSAGREGGYTRAFVMDVRDGVAKPVATAPIRNASFLADHHGVPRFAIGWDTHAHGQVYYRASATDPWALLYSGTAEQPSVPVPTDFSADDTRVYMSCTAPNAVGAVCPWDVASKTMLAPIWSSSTVDADSLVHGLSRRDVVAVRSMPGTPATSAVIADADTVHVVAALVKQFPGEDVQVVSRTDDGSKAIVLVDSDMDPGTYYLWDAGTGKATQLVSRAPWIKPALMASMQPVEFKSRDGLTLHGYLSTSPGKEQAKHLPLVVYVHGGPFGIRDEWEYDPYVQMLATHGYAVLQVNFRGSGGYGAAFERAGYKQWGGTMQDDLTDATRWAIAQGITDASRVCIFGGSYGGYASLEGAMKEPDLYRCAIGYVGVYDMRSLYKHDAARNAKAVTSLLADTWGNDPETLAASSPINHLDRLKAHVMLIVGGQDDRVPAEQGRAMHAAMNSRGIAHEWIYKPEEGHGFYDEKNVAELFQRIVAFLDHNIGSDAPAVADKSTAP